MVHFLKKYSYQWFTIGFGLIGLSLSFGVSSFFPAFYAQIWSIRIGLIGIPLVIAFKPFLSSHLNERAKILIFLILTACFFLSLSPYVNEIAYYKRAFFYYASQADSYWEGYVKLTRLFDKISPRMMPTWITWAAVSLIFLTLMIVSFDPLLRKPLKHLNPDDRLTKGEGPWKGSFMESRQLNYLKKNKTGLPLGRHRGALLRYKSKPQDGWLGGHHAVFAGSRAGKGVSCVIPAILDHEGSVVCLDIKGENFAVTRKHRESLGRKVIVLNPFSVIEKGQDSYNPLSYIRPDHLFRDLYVVADGMVKPEIGVNSHFSDLVRDLLSAAIEVSLKLSPKASLNDVAAIINSTDFLTRLNEWATDPQKFGERPANIANAFLAAGDKEQGSIITTLQRNTNWMASEEMRAFLKESTFSLDDLLDDKVDIFIVVPMDILKQQEIYFRLFTNLILGTVIRQAGTKKIKKPILMILDEFARLGRLEKFLDIVTVAAGCGIEAMFVAQDKAQIDHIWGSSAGTILGSCATVRAFGLGRTDNTTSDWVEKQIGYQTVLTKSKRDGKKEKDSYSEHRDKILTATDVSEMDANEMICFIRSHKILKLDRIIYHQDKDYKNKIEKNPLV